MSVYTTQLTLGTQIGDGHFGKVFEGNCHLNGKVAVKLLRQRPGESSADWAARSRALLAEAQTLKSAQHRNVVVVHQVVMDPDGVVHLVTEFCNDGSLDKDYKAGPLALEKVRKIATDVCSGLECVHSRGMVHRDVKPANILCNRGVYKIADFGLVTDRLLHGYASVAGYASHLAPETAGVTGVTSAKTDVWALGMTIYRLIHGHQFYVDQFVAFSPADFIARISRGGFASSLKWFPHVPDKWRKFIRKAMHDDPTQRFASIHEMSQALSPLPVVPKWNCKYAFDHVVWTRQEEVRTITVDWKIPSPRKHAWSATRIGGGKRPSTAGGTNGSFIGKTDAHAQLEAFFAQASV